MMLFKFNSMVYAHVIISFANTEVSFDPRDQASDMNGEAVGAEELVGVLRRLLMLINKNASESITDINQVGYECIYIYRKNNLTTENKIYLSLVKYAVSKMAC